MAKKPLTEKQKYQRLRSALRRVTMQSYPVISEAKRLAKITITEEGKTKVRYICSICNNNFNSADVAVDHIVPAGSLTSFNDVEGFVTKLFCRIENLQVLCNDCHSHKTYADRMGITFEEALLEKKVIAFKKLSVAEQTNILQSLYDVATMKSLSNAAKRAEAYKQHLLKERAND
jgi:5-methylcytosine-specific restriction endonuclease McrA